MENRVKNKSANCRCECRKVSQEVTLGQGSKADHELHKKKQAEAVRLAFTVSGLEHQ